MLGAKYRTYLITKEPAIIAGYYAAMAKMNEALNKKRILPDDIVLCRRPEKTSHIISVPQKIVIVLGESDNKSHHGIYGYAYPTDRFMMGMQKKKDKIAVFNAISPAPITREAVIRAFSLATARQIEPFYENTSLLEMARNAGFQTLWLSKQGGVGLHDTLVKVIAMQAHTVSFIPGQFDDTLLKPFSEHLREDTKQFFVLHLRGSHLGYKYGHNKADFERSANSLPKYRHYDATIANTDQFLESLTALVGNDKNTLFIYISDHGEIVNKGHGMPALDARQYEIPFVVWSENQLLIQQLGDSVDRFSVQRGSDKVFNTSLLPLVIAETMGYCISDGYRKQALDEGKYVFHVDGRSYPIESLKRGH